MSASENIRLCDLDNSLAENYGRNWALNLNFNKEEQMEVTELRTEVREINPGEGLLLLGGTCVCQLLSHVQLFVSQALLSMEVHTSPERGLRS